MSPTQSFTRRAIAAAVRAWAATLALAGAAGLAPAIPLTFTVLESGAPVPCRVHLKDAGGQAIRAPGLPFWHDHFVCAGVAELDLAPGQYRYEIERGPEYFTTGGELIVTAGARHDVTNQLRRLVNLSKEGWWSGELHVHRPPGDIRILMQAEDLHVAPVITWWNTRNLWRDRPFPSEPLVRFDRDRFYHLMGGEDERGGGALLFLNLHRPLEIANARREYPSPMIFVNEARQQPDAWIDIEKPFWYDVPVWLASGMVDSIGIAHNHMQRSGMLTNEAWGRARDYQQWPAPLGNGFWTEEIYYRILNCGLRLPPSAGSASGVLPNPVGYNRAYVHLEGDVSYEKWWQGLKAGRVFVSNGPLLRCRANGHLPGYVFKVAPGERLKVLIEASLDSSDPVATLEIIQNGRVIDRVPNVDRKRTGSLGSVTFTESGWFLVRAMADTRNTFRFASTGPFYVEAARAPRRISRGSARFFLDWVRERQARLELEDARQRDEVLNYQRAAERFWQEKVAQANAE